MKEKTKKIFRLVLLSLFCILLGAAIFYFIVKKYPNYFSENIIKVEKDVTVTDVGIADAVEKVYNSVVVINTYKKNVLYSSGSGFIYRIDGDHSYIITNHHVIDSGEEFKVSYTDGETVIASLVGSDEYADVAILKTETKEGYSASIIGKSDDMRVGDTTFTIGAPLGDVYSWTVTRGILSGKERLVEVSLSSSYQSDYIMNVLQTDSAVNSGNSGGPLCNSNGEVIGVINAKISASGVEGIGFAIPIEVAIEKAEEIINGESSSYPYLGITMYNVANAISSPLYNSYLTKNKITYGVIVVDIEANSPAFSAGIKANDIIIKINDNKVSNIAYLRYQLYKSTKNDKIVLTVIRDGNTKEIEVDLSK